MGERVERTAEVEALAAIAGLVHGFGRRAPGLHPETRDETVRRVRSGLDANGELQLLRQVHGCAVALSPWDEPPEADAAVAAAPGLLLGIQTADCLPVLLVDPVRRAVGAAHAGWRGTLRGVTREAVRALETRGSRAQDLVVALGPGIGACCYEVGDELREAFGPGGASFFRTTPKGRLHLDVRAANVRQLEEAGVPPKSIYHVPECTYCLPGGYHSYRRDGKGAGRMISFVGFKK
jgi:YfiH family protein